MLFGHAWIGLFMAACGAPEPEDTTEPTDTSVSHTSTETTDDTADPVLVTGLAGTIDFQTMGEVGQVDIAKAFGLAHNGKFIAYLSNNEDATCEDAIEHATPSEEAKDPSGFLVPGSCDMFMSVDWDGAFGAENSSLAVAGYAITCPLGDGSFVYEADNNGDYDYFWSGRWSRAIPRSIACPSARLRRATSSRSS